MTGRTYESNVNTTRGQGAAVGRPAETVLEDPSIKVVLVGLG